MRRLACLQMCCRCLVPVMLVCVGGVLAQASARPLEPGVHRAPPPADSEPPSTKHGPKPHDSAPTVATHPAGVATSAPSTARPAPTPADARDALMAGAYAEAIESYQALSKQPGLRLEAELGLGRCRLQTGDYHEAIASLTALDAPDGFGARGGLDARKSPAWHFLLAELYRRTGRYDEALAHGREAIQRNGNHAGARLLVARLLERLGRRDEAVKAYRWFDRQLVERADLPRDAAWITHTALGFLRYSVLTRTNVPRRTKHVLNEMLQVAYERIDRAYWPARIAAADLLREKFNNDEADGSLSDYQAALRINGHLAEAYTGIGEVLLTRWKFEEVERRVEQALGINPHYAPAVHLLAKKFLLERRYDQAFDACDDALRINPNDIVALSIRAAARACQYRDDAVRRLSERVAEINPRCALFHRTLGDALGGIRQYEASQREYRKAIELDPTDANARTELGMMYMQWGLERKARDTLEAAWALDRFNERTAFTLELLEMLAAFDRVETEHFIVRYDAHRDPGLGAFAADYLESIYDSVTGDFDTTLAGRTIVEFFPTHRAFGVRITGKPWIHTVGASTGRVIALASPHDTAHVQPYDLARVLRHEFTHTVTLEATHNRIPHWFTEGLAVYQEDAPRSFAWMQLLADAARRDRLFTLQSIDWGFIRPRHRNDRQLAYAQSEWMCEYLVERFGYDILNTMLGRFRVGETQPEVFRERLGVEPEAFDTAFEKWARDQIVGWGFDLTRPEDVAALREQVTRKKGTARTWGRLARAAYDQGDREEALKAARRAMDVEANEPNGLEIAARVLFERAKAAHSDAERNAIDEEALPVLERLLIVKPAGWTAPKYLGDIAVRRGDTDRAIEMFQRLQRLCPADPASWRGLAGIYLDRGEDDHALPQLLELARVEENDGTVAAGIARIYKRDGRAPEALYWFRRALYIDPFNLDDHKAVADTSMQLGDTLGALRAYKMLTKLEPHQAGHFADAAFAAHKLGDIKQARLFARQALQLDPDSPAGSLLRP